jgi:transcription elongation factor GreA
MKVVLEESELVEKRINLLNNILTNAVVKTMEKGNISKVIFGSTCEIEDLDTGDKDIYKLVGEYESQPEHKIISYKSPFAKHLLGKERGEEVSFVLNNFEKNFEIIDIYI